MYTRDVLGLLQSTGGGEVLLLLCTAAAATADAAVAVFHDRSFLLWFSLHPILRFLPNSIKHTLPVSVLILHPRGYNLWPQTTSVRQRKPKPSKNNRGR